MKRYLITLIGSSKGIDEDLNNIADERGVHYVDGKGLFLATFYSNMTTMEIEEMLLHRPAFLIFDITDPNSNAINLPAKYYTGLFPETTEMTDILNSIKNESNTTTEVKNKKSAEKNGEEYYTVDEILDKLSRNNYDRSCLTEKELNVLRENK